MPFKHGVFYTILPTLYRITQQADADVPVVVGLSPVHRIVGGAAQVNDVYLCLDPGATKAAMGYDSNWSVWTLSEYYYACFTLFNQFNKPAPVFVNVFDPTKHITTVASSAMTPSSTGVITIPFTTADVVIDSVVVKSSTGTTLTLGVNYITGYDSNNNFLITILDVPVASSYNVAYNKANPSMVTANDIIGGTTAANLNQGLSCINDVFPDLQVVPGILYAPGYENNTLVQAAADALVQLVNGVFRARTWVDLDNPTVARTPTGALTLKNADSITDSREDVVWPPMCFNGGLMFHAGTINSIAQGVITQNPAQGNGVPYWSVSNNLRLPITGVGLSDGTQITIRKNDADYLNNQGIVTFQQWEGTWYAWGNRTAAYPGANDVTQVFAVVQRELDWIGNSIVLSVRPWVDNPTNGPLILSITLSMQIWLSGLVMANALLKGMIEFLQADNPIENLMQGKVTFHYLLTPPLPAEDIENNLEFDVSGLTNLYNVVAAAGQVGLASGGGMLVT